LLVESLCVPLSCESEIVGLSSGLFHYFLDDPALIKFGFK